MVSVDNLFNIWSVACEMLYVCLKFSNHLPSYPHFYLAVDHIYCLRKSVCASHLLIKDIKLLLFQARGKKKPLSEQLRYCSNIIKELFSKKHAVSITQLIHDHSYPRQILSDNL